MRGDSLRDFYAKTVALLVLGMLAGAGALVDYWPGAVSLPAVSPRHLSLPSPASALGVPDGARGWFKAAAFASSRERVTSVADPERADVPTPPARPASEIAAVAVEANLVTDTAFLPLSDPVVQSETATSSVASGLVDGRPALDPALAEETAFSESAGSFGMRAAVSGAGGNDEGDGLITGAFKKTGSSIVKTSARTGASIFDAMRVPVRVVSGVVRRALPTD